jgi:hypothetical protein
MSTWKDFVRIMALHYFPAILILCSRNGAP